MRSDLCCSKKKSYCPLRIQDPKLISTCIGCCSPSVFLTRISQDLAKDLAMLAREIHDVAGEIDSVSPAATDPGALVQTKKLLAFTFSNPFNIAQQ